MSFGFGFGYTYLIIVMQPSCFYTSNKGINIPHLLNIRRPTPIGQRCLQDLTLRCLSAGAVALNLRVAVGVGLGMESTRFRFDKLGKIFKLTMMAVCAYTGKTQ